VLAAVLQADPAYRKITARRLLRPVIIAAGEFLERVADALVGGRIAAPPITRITLEQAPAALNPAQSVRADGKTVITL
jgi:hypothetical protein